MVEQKKWSIYVLAALLLIALIGFGSRERSWSKKEESWKSEKTSLSDSLASQKTLNEQMTKDTDTLEETTPILLSNGQVAMATRRTSKTVETAMRQATEQMAQLKNQVSELQLKVKSKETEVVRSARLWNVVAGWEPMQGVYYAGGGVNLGPMSVWVDNPISLDLRPRISAMVRF